MAAWLVLGIATWWLLTLAGMWAACWMEAGIWP